MARTSGFVVESITPVAWNTVVAGTIETMTITAPGAKPGDFCLLSVECTAQELLDGTFCAMVTDTDQVAVAFNPTENTDGMAGSKTVRVKVIPLDAI